MLFPLLRDSLRRATGSVKWAFLLTAVNLILTLLALLPVVLWLQSVNGASLFGERLLKDALDIEWLLAALRLGKSTFLLRLLVAVGLAVLVGWLLTTFFAGGIIAAFVAQETPRNFWADCRQYVLPLLVAGAATLALQVAAGLVFAVAWGTLYGELTRDQTTPARAERLQWAGGSLCLLVLWSIRLVADYLRLALVVHRPRRSLRGQLRAGLGVLIHYPLTAVSFYIWTTVLWGIAAGGFVWLVGQVSPVTWFASGTLCLLSQLLVLARHWVGLVFIAGGCRLLEAVP